MCRLERKIQSEPRHAYLLALQNQYHEDVLMGGDSNCFAPPIYYLTVEAKLVEGTTADDGYGLFFEEINDECYALFRVREQMRKVSVVQTFDGGNTSAVYIRQKPAPPIRVGESNKLAILAIGDEHRFYINDAFVGQHSIARLALSRLDVGIIAGKAQLVRVEFRNFKLYVPALEEVE